MTLNTIFARGLTVLCFEETAHETDAKMFSQSNFGRITIMLL